MLQIMWNKVKKVWELWCDKGLRLPYAHDPVTKKPSVTLLMVYLTFLLAFASTITLHFYTSTALATWTSIALWVLSVVFYRMRKLDKAKISFEDQSIELNSSDD